MAHAFGGVGDGEDGAVKGVVGKIFPPFKAEIDFKMPADPRLGKCGYAVEFKSDALVADILWGTAQSRVAFVVVALYVRFKRAALIECLTQNFSYFSRLADAPVGEVAQTPCTERTHRDDNQDEKRENSESSYGRDMLSKVERVYGNEALLDFFDGHEGRHADLELGT